MKRRSGRKKKADWDGIREYAFRQWLVQLSIYYREIYLKHCDSVGVEPNWEEGYYRFLCLMSVIEK